MEITTEELKEKINKGDKVIVDFWGSWCGPCKLLKPRFEKAKQLHEGDVEFFTFEIDKDKDFVISEMGIYSVPTIKGFSNGGETYSSVGLITIDNIIELAKKL